MWPNTLCQTFHHHIVFTHSKLASSFVFMSLKVLIKKKIQKNRGWIHEYSVKYFISVWSMNELTKKIGGRFLFPLHLSIFLMCSSFQLYVVGTSSLHILHELLHLFIVPRIVFYFRNAVFCSFDTFDIKYPKEIKIISLCRIDSVDAYMDFDGLIVHCSFLMYSCV